MPAELSQMMDAFKQLQPPRPSPPSVSTTDQSSRVGKEERTGSETKEEDGDSKVTFNDDMTKLLDERLSEMEARLREYVDSKLASLENQLLSKLSTLSQRIDMLNQIPQMDNSSEQCTVSNGGLSPPLPLSEDPQLDWDYSNFFTSKECDVIWVFCTHGYDSSDSLLHTQSWLYMYIYRHSLYIQKQKKSDGDKGIKKSNMQPLTVD